MPEQAGRNIRACPAPAGKWVEVFFPMGGTLDVADHMTGFLTPCGAARAAATCRQAHSSLRWIQAQLEWPQGIGITLPDALTRRVAGPHVRKIRFRKAGARIACNPEVLDSWLCSIAEHCPGLRALDLSGCVNVTDAGLTHLARCTQLATLNLCGCNKVTDAGLAHLARCTQLAKLNLANSSR